VATSRRQIRDSNGEALGARSLVASYFGDTLGQPLDVHSRGRRVALQAFGCSQPLHFSPTIVQPDADDPTTRARARSTSSR
jgi:hypothetical protein